MWGRVAHNGSENGGRWGDFGCVLALTVCLWSCVVALSDFSREVPSRERQAMCVG